MIEFAYNNIKNISTHYILFELIVANISEFCWRKTLTLARDLALLTNELKS